MMMKKLMAMMAAALAAGMAMAGVARIGGVEYATLAEAFAAASGATTIELLADTSGCGIVVPTGSDITVNFNGHTYTVNAEPFAGSGKTKNQCFQLLRDSTVTFRNGAIVADNPGLKMIIQNYADLTLSGMTLDATQGSNNVGYVLSTNNGSTTIDNTRIVAKENGIAFDACCGWGGYESNEVEVTGNSQIVGDVEVSYYGQAGSTPATLALTSGTITGDIVMEQGGDEVEITKAASFVQEAPEGFVWRDNGDGTSELAQFGFVRAIFTGNSLNTSSIWDAENATVVSGVDDFISVASNDFPQYTTYAYATYMYLEAGVTYCIRSYVDDNMRVTVDDTTLISTGSKYYAAFRFAEPGWHKVELRFFNNGGPGGGSGGLGGCMFCGADGVWKRFNTANGQFRTDEPDGYAAAAPTIVYKGSGGTIDVSQYTGNDLVIELGPWASLPNNAFRGNSSITSVKIIGSGDMGTSAFENCTSLTKVEILGPSIGASAFKGCTSLSDLTLNCPSIGNSAFQNCTGLTGMLTIPRSVTSIESYAFEGCSGLTGVTMTNSVKTMSNYAFRNCTGLANVTTVGPANGNEFSGCASITSVTIIGGAVGNSAFSGKTGLTSLTIEDGVTSIGQSAFQDCTGLTGTLMIPGSVTSIGQYAFQNCTGLTGTLTIPEGVVDIGANAFAACTGFTSVSLPKTIKTICRAFNGDIGIKSVTIAEGSTIVGGFNRCTGLMEMEIPDSVTNIDAYAFAYCTQLVTINMPANLKVIGEGAFSDCRKLLKLEWPVGVTVGGFAFQNCSNWQGVFTVPEGVSEIPESVFRGCSGLQQIKLPTSLTKVGYLLFDNCTSLEEVNLPYGLTAISAYMFQNCRSLTKILIPNTVTEIADGAFSACSSLTEIAIPNSVVTLGEDTGKRIYIAETDSYTGVGYGNTVFSQCAKLTAITLPSSLVNIHRRVFGGWNGSITFEGELPVGFELFDNIFNHNVAFRHESGSRGFITWPVTQFMGYTQTNAPTVTIVSSKIRENDPEVMDVVYKVNSTKPTVKVRALAFEDGVRSFAKVVRPEDFIADLEGNETKGNIGDAVTANVEHTLSWKVSSDWATRLAKVSFEVLATEDDILPLELMTIPGTPAHPETWQISWNYITTDKTFEALLWLYADKDLGLTLQNGVLKNGDTRLCSGASVSAYDALVYVYGKMGFTLLDGDALDYVREATRFNLPDKSGRQYAYRVLTPAGE